MKVSIRHLLLAVAVTVAITCAAIPLQAQGLGWEGETGVFVTPLAYTAGVEGEKVHPVVAYHYLNAGSVIGDFHEISLTFGILSRFEIGYTHEFHTQGDDPSIEPALAKRLRNCPWQGDVNTGKLQQKKLGSGYFGGLHVSAGRAQCWQS